MLRLAKSGEIVLSKQYSHASFEMHTNEKYQFLDVELHIRLECSSEGETK